MFLLQKISLAWCFAVAFSIVVSLLDFRLLLFTRLLIFDSFSPSERIISCAKKYNSEEDNFVRIQANQIEEKSASIIKLAKQKWKTMEDKLTKEKKEKALMSKRKTSKARQRCEGNKSSSSSASSLDEGYESSSSELSYRESDRRMSLRNRRLRKTRASKRKRSKRSIGNQVDIESSSDESIEEHEPKDSETFFIEGSDIPFCRRDLSTSAVVPCNDRDEWKRLCPKLAMVCNEAARRSTLRVNPKAKRYEKPLSEVYIEERLNYDNPLNGFIVKTKNEPHHVQGFIITTNFVTWRRTFRWTTRTPASIVTPTDHRIHATDFNGKLAEELDAVKREGSDSTYGFTSDRVCEISLLGKIGN